jgi:hypothetical protein
MSGTADAVVILEGPAELATLNAKSPALFVADEKSSERFWEFTIISITIWRDIYRVRAIRRRCCSARQKARPVS